MTMSQLDQKDVSIMKDQNAGTYVFSKYTLRNERYTFGGDTLVQGDRAYGLSDPFEIIDTVTDPTSGGKVLHRAWDVYEDESGQRYSVEIYNEDIEAMDAEPLASTYESQAARDAAATGYGSVTYPAYLDRQAREMAQRFPERAEHFMTRSLSEALAGNDGV
jgi:hypothetical protein